MHVTQPHRKDSNRVHGVNGPSRRCRRLQFEPINVSPVQNGEVAYLQHADVTRPLEIPSKRYHRVHIPIRQCSRTKFEPTKVSQMRKIETAHLARAHTAQPHGSPPKRSCKVIGPKRRRGRLKIAPASISQKRKEQNTYQGLYKPIHPLPTRSIQSCAIHVHWRSSIRPPVLEEQPCKRLAAKTSSLSHQVLT